MGMNEIMTEDKKRKSKKKLKGSDTKVSYGKIVKLLSFVVPLCNYIM